MPVSVPRSDEKPSTNATRPPRRDPRRLQLPLRRVHALHRARFEVDQAEPGVVPGAFRGLVAADRRHLPAGPAELEDVDALRRDVPRVAGRGVDEPEPPPELRGPEDLRILCLRAGLLDLGRRVRAGTVGPEIGGEHEQPSSVRRPVDVLDRARDLTELAVVDPERQAPLVSAVGGEGEPRPVGREARQRTELAGLDLAVDLASPEPRLDRLALLAKRGRDGECDPRAIRRERDVRGSPELQHELGRERVHARGC